MTKEGVFLRFDDVTIAGMTGSYAGKNIKIVAFGLKKEIEYNGNYKAEATLVIILPAEENRPPTKPRLTFKEIGISEPNNLVNLNEHISFTFTSNDPDGDRVKFRYSWTGRTGTFQDSIYVSSGEFTVWHAYDEMGTFDITVTAIDSHGLESVTLIHPTTVY